MLLFCLFLRGPFNFTINGDRKSFSQSLDHFSSHSSENFTQYYFENSSFADQELNSFIVFLGSESAADSNFSEGVLSIASSTKSAVYSLEHRFFGDSHPNVSLTAKNLSQLLTTSQVLGDIAKFVSNVLEEHKCNGIHDCTVTIIGGGYLGSLASWFKLKYPHLATNAYASSAPMILNETDALFDFEVINTYDSISDCHILDNLEYLYTLAENNTVIENFKNSCGFDADQSIESFYYVLSEAISMPVVYSHKSILKQTVCQVPSTSTDKLRDLFHTLKEKFDFTPQSLDPYYYKDPSPYSEYREYRAWTWLKCNEIGLWHVVSNSTESKRIKYETINETYFNNVCTTLFDQDLHVLDSTEYGNADIFGTNIAFSYGSSDPLRHFSIKYNNSAYHVVSYNIEGGHHCDDLSLYSQNATQVQKAILSDIYNWNNQSMENVVCEHGVRVFGYCKCDNQYGGDLCNYKVHAQSSFKIITILAVAVPTLLLLIIGALVWFCGKREDNEIGARPTLYT